MVMTLALEPGDRVLGKDGRGFMVEMTVEDSGYTEGGELMVTCVWPIFEDGRRPLYRRALPRAELVLLEQVSDMQAMHIPCLVSPEERTRFFEHVQRPTTSAMVVVPAPQFSPEALDQMERAWTPNQVRALIADYRKLAGYP